MPRKTNAQIAAEGLPPVEGSLLYWQTVRTKEQALNARLQAEHRQILIDKARRELVPFSEVQEMFARVFGAYRAATKEIDRRYGPEAAAILIQAERTALYAQEESGCMKKEKSNGDNSQGKATPPAKSTRLRNKKS